MIDTGPGIAPDEIPYLFEKYWRAAKDQHREGQGLGLYIVKALAEAHGGTVQVESTRGVGTRFSVCLPALPSDDTDASAEASAREP